jgi:hypothetical protein
LTESLNTSVNEGAIHLMVIHSALQVLCVGVYLHALSGEKNARDDDTENWMGPM